MRPALEVADILAAHGASFRALYAGRLSGGQRKVLSAIEACRTASLGGHVEVCQDCDHQRIAYNSCRNRHCPKCQSSAARDWLAARQQDLLPVGYFHVVFTLPAELGDIARQNKAAVYDLLFRAASQTMRIIAADPRHLGARIGITAVLHTWGSAMMHHPHVHMIVPGGGISLDGTRWIHARSAFLLPVKVLSRLFRRLFLSGLAQLHGADKLLFCGKLNTLQTADHFSNYLARFRKRAWVVYAKAPFSGPDAVLAYLSRYTHRVAISNSRLLKLDTRGVTFRYKDYRRQDHDRQSVMTLTAHEFIRRFLMHVLPRGFHRIRHYGILSTSTHQASIAKARMLLQAQAPKLQVAAPEQACVNVTPQDAENSWRRCPCCGGTMVFVGLVARVIPAHAAARPPPFTAADVVPP